MNTKRCCFAGHKDFCKEHIQASIQERIEQLIEKENVTEFWVGNYGKFDKYVATVVQELKKRHKNIKLELVLPYLTKDIITHKQWYYTAYDSILIADMPEKTPKRCQIIKTNEYMIQNSDFLICYVSYDWGGAAKTLEYAKRSKRIQIINLA